MGWFRRWREQRILRRYPLPTAEWEHALATLPVLSGLSADEQQRLYRLTVLFLHAKTLEPVRDLQLTQQDRLLIGVHACLPILELGLDWYSGWSAVVVYPEDFLGTHAQSDDAGVVRHEQMLQSGESWQRGPVIVSLADVHSAGHGNAGNVVIHEMAHKLDMLNGAANGCPPLHKGMRIQDWTTAFQAAFDDLEHRVDSHIRHSIDAYASESPAECFAVFSEYFFERPALLQKEYPAVYDQMRQFYRRDPLARLTT